MARSPANLLTAAALLGLPATGMALGLGDIQLKSALNQPLDAQIEILGATPQDLRDLHAAIAGRDTFSRYGLEYSQLLGSLHFSVEKGTGGSDVLRLTSAQPMSEPFITFLIEAEWTRGRLLREYTVLLDPPVFMPEPSAPVAVEAPSGAAAQPAPGAGAIERPLEPAQPSVASEAPQPARPSVAPAAATPVTDGEYRVRRGDTLWVIASRTRVDSSTSLNQMMVALYRANPEAFLGNMNLLKEGSTLRVPGSSDLSAVSDGEATREFARQTAEWQGGASAPAIADEQLKLVPPKALVADGAATQPGASTTTSASVVPAQPQNAKLSAQVKDLQRQLDEANSRLQVKDAELARMQQALSDAGTQPEASAPSVEAPGAAGVDLESAQTTTGSGAATEVVPEAVASDSFEPVAEEPAAEPAPVIAAPAPTPEPRKSWLDAALGQTWVWVAAGLALVLAAGGLALKRRKSALAPLEALDNEAATARPRVAPKLEPVPTAAESAAAAASAKSRTPAASVATAGPATDTGTFEITGTFRPVDFDTGIDGTGATSDPSYPFEDSGSALAIDQADPISEADFHLAYGLYDQAAELIKKALDREPGRSELQLKLLEILFMWGNRDAFRERAQAFRSELVRSAKWDTISVMGKQICPGDALFASAGAPADGGVDLDLAVSGEMASPLAHARSEDLPSLDFDLDDALTAKADLHAAETVPATGEYLEMTRKEETEEIAVHDEQLTAVARRLEARMRPRAGDIGVALDLGETIAPEDVSATRTLVEGRPAQGDDDAFGDFFAFTGVAEAPEPDPTGTREVVLDFEGDMLPDSTTAEFKIELPDDGGGLDLDIGATGAHLPTLRTDGAEGDTTRVLTQSGGDTTVVSSFGDTATMQAPEFVDPTARTVQAPRPSGLGTSFDLLSGSDETISADALDLDIGGGDDGDGERHATVRVSAADLALPEAEDGVLDEVGTKLDLARAYIDMGDPDGARSILEEVVEEGDESQRQNANTLLRSIA